MVALLAPFPYFGGKRSVVADVWRRLGEPKQYIEPFCGSAAMLLGAPRAARLEVICDASGYIANFWRATKHQPDEVARWADYPVSHIDLGARHRWLMERRDYLAVALHDPDWPGDAKVAGWWLWGQCCWIGSGWCDWKDGRIPAASDAGRGVQAIGQIPHASNAGMDTSCGYVSKLWLRRLADRLERVRIVHGDWQRCLNHHYGGSSCAVFLDPPYRAYERVYSKGAAVADEVETWARGHGHLRVALCGHAGDYQLKSWKVLRWKRQRLTYGGSKTTGQEAIWFSPGCFTAAAKNRKAA